MSSGRDVANMSEATQTTGLSTWRKILKTVCLVSVWICLGLTLEVTGPTLKDLKLKTGANYEDVSRAISGRSVGTFIGAVFGGALVDKLPRFWHLMIALCIDGIAVAIATSPHVNSVELLWFLFVLSGVFEAVINVAGQKLILNMWLDKASSPMHALHLGFGIGSFIVPEIANPFLAVPAPTESHVNTNGTPVINITSVNNSMTSYTTPPAISSTTLLSTTVEYVKGSRIEWAYLIVSIITLLLSIVFYFYQFCNCGENTSTIYVEDKKMDHLSSNSIRGSNDVNDGEIVTKSFTNRIKSFVKIADPGSCTGGRRVYGVALFMLLFLYYFTAVGGERIYGKFIRTYSIDQLKFDGDEASLLNTAFWISFSCGRFAGFISARWIPIRILIIAEACGCLVTAIILNVFAHDDHLLFWVFSMPMGFFIGPLFPTGIAWGDFHVEMTGMAITFCLLGGSLGGTSYMWIIGYLYDNYGYHTFLYQTAGFGVSVSLFALLLTFVSCGQGNRFNKDIETTEEVEVQKEKQEHIF